MISAGFLLTLFLLQPTGALSDISFASSILLPLPQEADDKPGEGDKAEQEKPPEYPALSALHKQQVKRLFTSFKNRNPSKRREFEKDMIKIGRGAIPTLIQKGATKHKDEGECIFNCLLALLDEHDVVTLRKCYESKTERLRLVAVIKIASFKNIKFQAFLKEALKDKNEDIRLEAALGLVSIKDASGIGEIILKMAKNRKNPSPRLVENLPLLKHKSYPSYFYSYLVDHEDPEVRMTTADIIALIGDPRLKPALGKALNDSHNLVQAAAVNALRKMVNGEEPRNYSNVFELIEEVNKWKKDLGIVR